jgi:hypothetical protein
MTPPAEQRRAGLLPMDGMRRISPIGPSTMTRKRSGSVELFTQMLRIQYSRAVLPLTEAQITQIAANDVTRLYSLIL